MVTNSSDNSLKVWSFTDSGDDVRVLYQRSGHSKPVSFIDFYDDNQSSSGFNLMTTSLDSSMRLLSPFSQSLDRNLGTATTNVKLAKRVGVKRDPNKMPPVIEFSIMTTRNEDWDDIACIHEGIPEVTTWSSRRFCMGRHKLVPERLRKTRKGVTATGICITPCGNFVVIGYSDGLIDRFNMQSGLHRIAYGKEDKDRHTQPVTGVTTDGLNQLVITSGVDGMFKMWSFKHGRLVYQLNLGSPVTLISHAKDSSLVAFGLDSCAIKVIDIESRKLARVFPCISNTEGISCMIFSPDSKWLIVSTKTGVTRVYDMLKARMVDSFKMPIPCRSLSFSPNHEFLASSHDGMEGVYLWSNKTLFKSVSLKPLEEDFIPQVISFPTVCKDAVEMNESEDEVEASSKRNQENEGMDYEYSSPEQISQQLITLSLTPSSSWKNLFHLDLIKVTFSFILLLL